MFKTDNQVFNSTQITFRSLNVVNYQLISLTKTQNLIQHEERKGKKEEHESMYCTEPMTKPQSQHESVPKTKRGNRQ